MNSLLHELANNFTTSRPIFRLRPSDDKRVVDVKTNSPIYKYDPPVLEGDALSELMSDAYSENFSVSSKCFRIDKQDIVAYATRTIRVSIRKFIENNSEMKSPRQSKLYRWAYRNMPTDDEFNSVLIMMYKYMRSFSNKDMVSYPLCADHVKNTFLILESVMEKYSEK